MSLKQHLPPGFKQFLWFVFKSPQRGWIGYSSLFTDLKAWLSTRRKPRKLSSISVCIGIKNRSDNLLTHLLPSLNACVENDLIELSIFDCGSTDQPDLKAEIQKIWKGRLVYHSEPMDFARSVAFNRAVKQSIAPLVVLCDADMSLPPLLLERVNRYCTRYSAWFPHVVYTNKDGSTRWYTESTGMMAARRTDYLKTGGLDESIRTWGKEDWLLFFEFYKKGIGCIRSNEPEFIHHYHDSLKPKDFQPLF